MEVVPHFGAPIMNRLGQSRSRIDSLQSWSTASDDMQYDRKLQFRVAWRTVRAKSIAGQILLTNTGQIASNSTTLGRVPGY